MPVNPYTEFLNTTYQNELGREADPDGLANWQSQLANGMSEADVIAAFNASQEGTAYDAANPYNIFDQDFTNIDWQALGVDAPIQTTPPDTSGVNFADPYDYNLLGVNGQNFGQGFEVPPGSAIDTGNPALDTYVPGGGVDGPNPVTPVTPVNTIDPVTQTPVETGPSGLPLNQGNFTDDLNAWQDSVYDQTPLINSYNRSAGLWEDLQGQRSSGEGIASINPDAPGQLYQAFGEAYQYDPNAGNYRSINTGNVIGHPGAPPADIGVQPNYDDYTASTLPANSAVPDTVVPAPVVPEDTGAGGEGTGGTNF